MENNIISPTVEVVSNGPLIRIRARDAATFTELVKPPGLTTLKRPEHQCPKSILECQWACVDIEPTREPHDAACASTPARCALNSPIRTVPK